MSHTSHRFRASNQSGKERSTRVYGYYIATVFTGGKSVEEVDSETLQLMNANGRQGRRFVRWDEGEDYRKLWFELDN
jgi:hypothetical protein